MELNVASGIVHLGLLGEINLQKETIKVYTQSHWRYSKAANEWQISLEPI